MMDFQNIGVLINEFNCTGFRVEVDRYINLMTRIYLIYFTPGTFFDSLIVPLFQIKPTKSSKLYIIQGKCLCFTIWFFMATSFITY